MGRIMEPAVAEAGQEQAGGDSTDRATLQMNEHTKAHPPQELGRKRKFHSNSGHLQIAESSSRKEYLFPCGTDSYGGI